MKRKITSIVLITLASGALCFLLWFAFGFFTAFNSITAWLDIKSSKVQIADIGELPINHVQKQQLANSYGFDFYYFGCNISTAVINGTKYYNNVMIDHLENKFGAGWWKRFQQQLDSIDHADLPSQLHELDSIDNMDNTDPPKRLSFKNISELVADSSYSTWVKLQGDTASLALHFQYKDTLAVSYSPECWLMYPYKLKGNRIIVYWDNIIDTKYNFDIVKAVNKTAKKYIGKPFIILELQNDTTLHATYPFPDLIQKINNASKERTFFSDTYTIAQDGYL